MEQRKIYAIVGCIYLGVLLVFASSESHENFDTIPPSDDQLLLIKTEATTESLFVNAASNSAYLAENEVDVSGDNLPTTKQQGHDIDPSTIFSTNQQSHSFNSLSMTSTKQDDTSKLSSTKQMDHNVIPVANLPTKHQSNKDELLSIKQHTENLYLATSLSTKLPSHNNNASANISIKQHNHNTDPSVTVMTSHLGYNSDPLTQRSTKQQASNLDRAPSIQLSTKQHTFNDDPSTLESTKEKHSAALKAKNGSDPVTMLITKPKVDSLNDITVKPSSTLMQNLDTTKSSTTSKKPQTNAFTSSIQGPPIPKNIHIMSASENSLSLSLESLSSGQSYIIKITTDQFANFSKIFNTTKKEFRISSLIPGTLYKIFVSIAIEKLHGEEFKLENYTVPVAPQLNISRINASSVQFSIKTNGTLCKNVHINEELKNHSRIYEDGEACKMELVELCPGRKYFMTVWQTRDVWKSKLTKMKFVTKQNRSFNYTVHGNTLLIKWEELKEVGCPIQGYNVYMSDGRTNFTDFCQRPEYSTTVHAGYTYIFQIQTIYENGVGEISDAQIIPVSKKLPGPVQNVTILNLSATTVQISIQPPKQTNGDILGYLITTTGDKFCQTRIINCTGCLGRDLKKNPTFALPIACKKKICSNHSMHEVETLSKEFTIGNLSPYHKYKIKVLAYNKEGCGNETQEFFKTLESTPSIVRHLRVTSVTNSSIELKYKAPKYKNGIISNYTIQVCFKRHICKHAPGNNEHICSKFNTSEKEYVLKNLAPYWLYILRVYAWTSKGFGESSKPISITTNQSVPTQVENLKITKVTNTSLEFQWERPCFPNGNITKYRVEYKTDTSDVHFSQAENLAGKLEKLHPYKMYTIKVSACTRLGCSKSGSVKKRTLVGIPMNVRNVQVQPISSTSVIVNWDEPQDQMGPTNYSVETLDNGRRRLQGCQAEGFQSKECTVTHLDEYWLYSFRVTAITSAGHSFPMKSQTVRTLESIPGCVTKLYIGFKCFTRMYVKWEPPAKRERNGIIHKYCVSLLEQNGSNQTQIVNETHRYQEFTVKTEHNFTVQVRAITKIGEGPITEKTIIVPAGPPVIPEGILFNSAPFLAKDRSKQIAILLPMKFFSNDSNGQPIMWGLIVAQSEAVNGNNTAVQMILNEFHPKSMRRWQEVHDNDIIQPYRPTDDDWKPPAFYGDDGNSHYILGADRDCNMGQYYCNGYLQPGRHYRIKAFMCTRGGCSETRYSGLFYTEKDLSPVYISTPILLTIAVISFGAVFFMWRKQLFCFQKRTIDVLSEVSPVHSIGETNKSFIMNLEPRSRIIRLDEFHEKVERMKKDSNLLFCEEFQLLRSCSPSKSHSAAELQANRTKNRYTNILAFDHSRVKLLPLDDEEGSDYINANYMPGYQSKREYIAAQGPLPGTKDDFWRMIWEKNVSVVVMVTQAVERGRIKCEIYWPTGTDPVYFGDLVVQLRSESNLSDYILRILDVQSGEEKREVKHFHFLKWPDFGCPANTSLLINFIQTVRSYMPYTATGPTIIHCSAGVGRTGTFIAIDWLLQHIREHQEVDIFGLILEMRMYRVNMVQTEDQYIFIHQCIADHLRQAEGLVEEDVYMNDTQM